MAYLQNVDSYTPSAKGRIGVRLMVIWSGSIAASRRMARVGGYARLMAYVSVDERLRLLAEVCLAPTAQEFVGELIALRPDVSHDRSAGGGELVYAAAALLALITSYWRIRALGDGGSDGQAEEEALIAFCAAGVEAMLGEPGLE